MTVIAKGIMKGDMDLDDKSSMQRIQQIEEMLGHLAIHAQTQNKSVGILIDKAIDREKSIERLMREVQASVIDTVNRQIEVSVDRGTSRLTRNWDLANQAADKATQTFIVAEQSLNWKLFAVASGVVTIVVIALSAFMWWALKSDADEGKLLRDKKVLVDCPIGKEMRLCAKIDPNNQKLLNGYVILDH